MNPLYVDTLYSNIHVRHHCLEIISTKKTKIFYQFKYREIPYDALIIQRPHGSISYDAMNWLKEHNVSTIILDWDSSILAQILPSERYNAELRLRQYDAYNSKEMHFFIVKELIETKTKRQYELLKELSQYYSVRVPDLIPIRTTSLDFIRNVEARYATQYFTQYGKICNELGYDFKSRSTKHNKHAKDVPNALLNYGYALLQTYVRRAISSIGLDSSLSFLHYLDKGTASLTFDLMEIFRPNIDFSVLQCLEQFSKKNLRAYHEINSYQVWLKSEAIKILFDHIKLNLELFDIINATRTLSKYILKESKILSFNPLPIIVKRKVSPDTKRLILTNSARQLGMNKSTHYYMKQRLLNSGTLNIYNSTRNHFTKQELATRRLLIKHKLVKSHQYNEFRDPKVQSTVLSYDKFVKRQTNQVLRKKFDLTDYQKRVMSKAISKQIYGGKIDALGHFKEWKDVALEDLT